MILHASTSSLVEAPPGPLHTDSHSMSAASSAGQHPTAPSSGGIVGAASVEDPFVAVKSDVEKNMDSARKLFDRWSILMSQYNTLASNPVGRQELDYSLGELQNSLRNIEWDLEDLEETIGIVEKNPRKFRLDEAEVTARRGFVVDTRRRVQEMKARIERLQPNTPVALQPAAAAASTSSASKQLLSSSSGSGGTRQQMPNYAEEAHATQQLLLRQQDETLERLSGGIGVLKDISHRMGSELDEQAVILDEFGREMDTTESKLDTTMKKMARVLHMSNDRRQWTVIGVLLAVLIVLVVLLFVL